MLTSVSDVSYVTNGIMTWHFLMMCHFFLLKNYKIKFTCKKQRRPISNSILILTWFQIKTQFAICNLVWDSQTHEREGLNRPKPCRHAPLEIVASSITPCFLLQATATAMVTSLHLSNSLTIPSSSHHTMLFFFLFFFLFLYMLLDWEYEIQW